MTTRQVLKHAARLVARAEGIPVGAVLEPAGSRARRARAVAFYLAATGAGVPPGAVAQAASVARTSVYRSLARVEDARDDPDFENFMTALEDLYAQGL